MVAGPLRVLVDKSPCQDTEGKLSREPCVLVAAPAEIRHVYTGQGSVKGA